MALEEIMGEKACNDFRGGELNREEVGEARMEKVDFMKKMGSWRVVMLSQAEGKNKPTVK